MGDHFWNYLADFFQFLHHETWLLCPFLAGAMYTLDRIRAQHLRISDFHWLTENCRISLYHSWNPLPDFFLNFVFFFIVMKHKFSVNFSWCYVYLDKLRAWNSKILDFQRLAQNFQNYYHLWNYLPHFFQILHCSSVSWKVTPLQFLADAMYTLDKMWFMKFWIFSLSMLA